MPFKKFVNSYQVLNLHGDCFKKIVKSYEVNVNGFYHQKRK